jgi:nitroreductase
VQPETIRASVFCAVQNLWLAARVEGLGVGWVSILEPAALKQEFGLPDGVEPAAYLCVGHPTEFRQRPLFEETGWNTRVDTRTTIHYEHWSAQDGEPTAR